MDQLNQKVGCIDAPIARKDDSIIERIVSTNGQNSITNYKVLKYFDDFSLVECVLGTGRTHQIRVHMSFIGHPLLGDSLYGNPSDLICRQALHCYNLKFVHPVLLSNMNLFSPIPDDFYKLIKKRQPCAI